MRPTTTPVKESSALSDSDRVVGGELRIQPENNEPTTSVPSCRYPSRKGPSVVGSLVDRWSTSGAQRFRKDSESGRSRTRQVLYILRSEIGTKLRNATRCDRVKMTIGASH